MRHRIPAIIVLGALALSACAGGGGRDEGIATLDALNDAQKACADKGGTLQLKTDGNPNLMDAYACVRK
jgi:hypothetical protein